MKANRSQKGAPRRSSDEGSFLVETMVALAILLTAMAGLLAMDGLATNFTENYGHLQARTAEYAQDKMEQLLVLSFNDTISDTRVFPSANSGGTGLGQGGSSNPATPAANYVDYLDANGNLLASSGTTAPTGWYFKRVWAVSDQSATLKQITVTVTVALSFGRMRIPQSTMVALKSFPF